MIADENEEGEEKGDVCTKFRLVGVVVHSGQASGGHYYSYILHRYVQGYIDFCDIDAMAFCVSYIMYSNEIY